MLNIEAFARTDELFDGHYRLLRPLSTDGGSADVWLALDTNTIDNYPSYEEITYFFPACAGSNDQHERTDRPGSHVHPG